MGLASRLIDAVGGRRKVVHQETNGAIRVNALCSAYENLFAQVRPLIDEMATVMPYGVGKQGGRLPLGRTSALSALLSPNDEMGWGEFADLMFATWLTEDELNIRVHRTGRNIYGYTIIPIGSKVYLGNGRYYYQVVNSDGQVEQIEPTDVMTLRFSRSPRAIDKGVSPASSVFTWSQVDDLFAQYQKAFIENGAVPASITFITASTKEKYLEAKREMERNLGGAKNKNKTLFIWRQLLDTGEMADQVQIKTIQGTNSTLALDQVMKIINDKLNKAVGVSNFILGDDSSAKYDNAELSDRQFTKRRVYPALKRFWGQFQHELDRILGGLGYAIQFDLEIPELTDRAKTRAEIAKTNSETLAGLIGAGSRPSAARIALGLGEDWQFVADGIYEQHIADRQASEIVARAESAVAKLEASERFLAQTVDNTTDTKKCEHNASKCESGHVCQHSADSIIVESLTEEEKQYYEKLGELLKRVANVDIVNLDLDDIKEAIAKLIESQGDKGANMSAEEIVEQIANTKAGAEIQGVLDGEKFHVSDDFNRKMNERTDTLLESFTGEAREAVAQILNSNEAMTQKQLQAKLEEALTSGVSDESLIQKLVNRAATIARNETVFAVRLAALDNDKYLYGKYDIGVEYEWVARRDRKTCNVCAAMDGQRVELGERFSDTVSLELGTELANGKIVGEDTKGVQSFGWIQDKWNDDGRVSQAHVNCRCRVRRIVVRVGDNVLENDRKIAGVAKGEPMNHEEADSGKVNPYFKRGGEYSENCQTCVVAYMARRKGYNVEALPKQNDAQRLLAIDSAKAFKNAKYLMGSKEDIRKMIQEGIIYTPKTLYETITDNMQEDAIYTLGFSWKGHKRDGHIVNVFKEDEKLVIYDPQNDTLFEDMAAFNYLKRLKLSRSVGGSILPSPVRLMRIDDLDFDYDFVSSIVKPKENMR